MCPLPGKGKGRLVKKGFSQMTNPVRLMQLRVISRKFRSSLSNLFFVSQVVV